MFHMTSDKNAMAVIAFLAVLVCMLAGYILLLDNKNNSEAGESLGFLVEPQCEENVKKYFAMLNSLKGFSAELLNIEYKFNIYSSINYYGKITSTLVKKIDLQADVSGAMKDCRANKELIFDLNEPKSIRDFSSYMSYLNKSENKNPVFIEVVEGQVIVRLPER